METFDTPKGTVPDLHQYVCYQKRIARVLNLALVMTEEYQLFQYPRNLYFSNYWNSDNKSEFFSFNYKASVIKNLTYQLLLPGFYLEPLSLQRLTCFSETV
ncbi:MAG: hypothetical protein JWR72_1208 [Flavisolibacter sp.]|jgi:hypothetical protein|nr:hypothetical protein [Flavisolibacter sp.]